jgi:hypothetical protein
MLSFSSKDVLKLDVTQKCLCLGNETTDGVVAAVASLDDDLVGRLVGLLGFCDGKRNLAFFLLRGSFRAGSRFRGWRCMLYID